MGFVFVFVPARSLFTPKEKREMGERKKDQRVERMTERKIKRERAQTRWGG